VPQARHAAQGTRNGQRGPCAGCSVRQHQLSLETEATRKKQQQLIRPSLIPSPAPNGRTRTLRSEDGPTGVSPRGQEWLRHGGVGENQGSDGEQQQLAAAGGPRCAEPGKRPCQPINEFLRQSRDRCIRLPVFTHGERRNRSPRRLTGPALTLCRITGCKCGLAGIICPTWRRLSGIAFSPEDAVRHCVQAACGRSRSTR